MGTKASADIPTFSLDGFEPIEKLGSGGFGVVWKARQKRIGRLVAIKVSETVLETEKKQLFFDRECESLGRLSGHPNIVNVYTAGHLNDGRPYLVLEYVEGGTLTSRLQQLRMNETAITELGLDLFRALERAHGQGVLHRDVKPDNIFLRANGAAVLGDFGIAQLQDATRSQTGSIIGSLRYMAPEVLKGNRPTTAADIYGVGITLVSAMTRQAPFGQPDNLVDQVMQRVLREPPDLSAARGYSQPLRTFVEQLVAKNPLDRPGSAVEATQLLLSTCSPEQKKRHKKPDEGLTTLVAPANEPPPSRATPQTNPPIKPPIVPNSPMSFEPTTEAQANRHRPDQGPNGTDLYPIQSPPEPRSTPPLKPPQPQSSRSTPPRQPPPGSTTPRPLEPRDQSTFTKKPRPPLLPTATVHFAGADHRSATQLAAAMSTSWDQAVAGLAQMQSQNLASQLTKAAPKWNCPQIPSVIREFPTASVRRRHQLMTDLIIALDHDIRPTYRGWDISLSNLGNSASAIAPSILDELRRGDILVRWRHHPAMSGVVRTTQEWERSIQDYDQRNLQLQISDPAAGGKLLECAADKEAAARIKSRLLAGGSHSDAGRQPWWADLYASNSVAGLLLAESTLKIALSQTATQQAREKRVGRRRLVRNIVSMAVAVITTLVCGIAASTWYSESTNVGSAGTGWYGLASLPFFIFWFFISTSKKRGIIGGGCLGSLSWVVYAATILIGGGVLVSGAYFSPTMSFFLASAGVTVPLFTYLTFRRLNARMRSKQMTDTVTYLST